MNYQAEMLQECSFQELKCLEMSKDSIAGIQFWNLVTITIFFLFQSLNISSNLMLKNHVI